MSSQISYTADPVFGCWLWTGKRGRDGYPLIWRGKRPIGAHRVVYELEYGELPDDPKKPIVLDHECRQRDCVNPWHLEPVTQAVNEQRKRWRTRVARAKCRRGHDMKVTAIVTPGGGRVCRQCNRDQQEGLNR